MTNAISDSEFPFRHLLSLNDSIPECLRPIDLKALSPFQRSLLSIDGTVTKFISAYQSEPIEVVCLNQESLQLASGHPILKTQQNSSITGREVILRGVISGVTYCYAVSLLVPDVIPKCVSDNLEENSTGIGGALSKGLIESRREILHFGLETEKILPLVLRGQSCEKFASRFYTVISDNQPMMLINEKFPLQSL